MRGMGSSTSNPAKRPGPPSARYAPLLFPHPMLIRYPPIVYEPTSTNLRRQNGDRMRPIVLLPVAAVASVAGVLVGMTIGQEQPMGHNMMGMQSGAMGASDAGPAAKAFQSAMDEMMKGMMAPFTGDVDVDFARGMIAHHEGAIAMAEVELEHGKDTGLRSLAERIITTQDAEITLLKGWLAKKDE